MNISNKEVSLVTVKDHARNTLNLEVSTRNRIIAMILNLEDIWMPNMIHLHKQTGEVIYSDLMKATLKLSKVQFYIAQNRKSTETGEGGKESAPKTNKEASERFTNRR